MVQEALAGSEALRREVVERAAEIEELGRPDIQARFDRAKGWKVLVPAGTGAGRPGAARSSEGGWLWRLLRAPAFAYGFMLLVAAYPTARWLAAERERAPVVPSSRPPIELAVLPSQALVVRGQGEVTLRGSEGGPSLPELALDPVTQIVDVTVWAPSSWLPGAGIRHAASVSSEQGVIWRDDDFRGLVTILGEHAFRLALNRKQLTPGVVTIRIDRIDPAAATASVPIYARFRVMAGI